MCFIVLVSMPASRAGQVSVYYLVLSFSCPHRFSIVCLLSFQNLEECGLSTTQDIFCNSNKEIAITWNSNYMIKELTVMASWSQLMYPINIIRIIYLKSSV